MRIEATVSLCPGAGLPASTWVSLCPQEVDLGPEVAKEEVLTVEPGMRPEAEAQPPPAMTSSSRDSAGVEVAVLADDLMPIVDQRQVLAR